MRISRSMLQFLSVVTASFAVLACAGHVSAALIAYEGFDYPAGTDNLDGQSGGSGWSDNWLDVGGTSGTSSVQSPGATYPSLVTVGNKAFISASNQNARTLSAGTLGSGDETVWISFIGQRVGANNIRFFGVSFYEGSTSSSNERFSIGEGSNDSDDVWNARFQSSGTGVVDTTVPVTTESLLLVKINYHSGANDDLHLWANPDLSLGEPAQATADASSIGNFNLAFDIVSLRAGTSSGGNIGEANYDEIRIADTFSDVAPIPEPASLMLALVGMTALAPLARRRRAATKRIDVTALSWYAISA